MSTQSPRETYIQSLKAQSSEKLVEQLVSAGRQSSGLTVADQDLRETTADMIAILSAEILSRMGA